MARKKSNHVHPLLIIIVGLFCLWAFVFLLQHVGSVLMTLGVVAAIIFGVKRHHSTQREALRRDLWNKVETIIHANIDPLTRRRAQLVYRDAYGKQHLDRWDREIETFMDHHIVPGLTPEDQAQFRLERQGAARLITQLTFERIKAEPVFAAFSDDMTPAEFENFCAEQLNQAGWNAHVTLRSRDQGVDVVAEKSGLRVALQCKLYTGPVGNKAVQEITAGREHEQADYGAVVTNSRYTAAAEQLASSNDVLLLHFRDLANLEGILSRTPAEAR